MQMWARVVTADVTYEKVQFAYIDGSVEVTDSRGQPLLKLDNATLTHAPTGTLERRWSVGNDTETWTVEHMNCGCGGTTQYVTPR